MVHPWLSASFNQLCSRLKQNQLHHGLLINGIEGIGKLDFAKALAQTILCSKNIPGGCGECQACVLYKAHSHPDYYQISSEKQIGVDLIRVGIEKLSGTSQLSGNKVLIIEKADSMTESAANALLKTLEEPTAKTYLMLVTDNPQKLLPTILSRCEKVSLVAPAPNACIAWLEQNGIEDINDDFIFLNQCAPLRILHQLKDDSGVSYDAFLTSLQQISDRLLNPTDLAESLQKDADKIVVWLQAYLRKTVVTQMHSSRYWKLINDCQHAIKALNNPGTNRILILSGLFSQLPGLRQHEYEEK